MTIREILAGAALLTLAAGCAPRATSPSRSADLHDAVGPVRLAGKLYTDAEGNTVALRLDSVDKVGAMPLEVTSKQGTKLEVHSFPLNDVHVCLPRVGTNSSAGPTDAAKTHCQPASSITEGTFIRMGTATCVCYVVNHHLWCYGSTCKL